MRRSNLLAGGNLMRTCQSEAPKPALRGRRASLVLAAVCLSAIGCGKSGGQHRAAVTVPAAAGALVAHRAPASSVRAPRAYLEVQKALALAGRSGGKYAVSARRMEGLVGPFVVGETVTVQDLLGRVARATGTELSWRGEIAVFQPPRPAGGLPRIGSPGLGKKSLPAAAARRRAAYALGESCRLEAIAPLCAALDDPDASVRRLAVLGLASFEGNFDHEEWPGRGSIFELPGVTLETDALLWLVEDEAAQGGEEWKAAVSVLGRAREGQLPRAIWWAVWVKTPGTIVPAIRALGRCGDPAVRRTLDKRIRNTFTNRAADRFTVARALARLGMLDVLATHAFKARRGATPGIRCAVAYGLGLCAPRDAALAVLEKMFADPDSRVRETAVFALGEMNTTPAAERLGALLADEKAGVAFRAAAAAALARVTDVAAHAPLFAAVKSPDARLRAAVAEALGDLGGRRTTDALRPMLGEGDRWVRAAAARSLAAVGVPSDALAKILLDSKEDPEVRIAIALGMGQGHSPEWAGSLGAVALDATAPRRLREYAVRSLAMLANRAGQPALKKLIEADPPMRMTELPLRYLDFGDDTATVAYLADYVLRGRTRHDQIAAVERVGELGTPEGTALLAGGGKVFDNHTRWTHTWYLIRSRSALVRRTLIELLGASRRSGVRINAALALAGRRDPETVRALIAACGDAHERVRSSAACALGECGDPAAAAALVRLMEKDEDIIVAHQALRALRRREFASFASVRDAFDRVRGTGRDCGAPGAVPPVPEQPANTWVLRRYARDIGDLRLPNLTYESSLTYDSVHEQMVQWGAHGRRADAPQTGMTWLLDMTRLAWTRPAPRQEPPGTCLNRGLTFDPVRALAISPKSGKGGHGWVSYLRKHAAWSVPWVFDARAGEWYPMRPPKHFGSHTQAPTCFDARRDVMLLASGKPIVYDAHANEWAKVSASGPLPKFSSGVPSAYDPVTGRCIVATGADSRGRARTWAFDLGAKTWTDLMPENPPPPLRSTPMVYDAANDVMLAFHSEPGRIAVYVYHLRENRWEAAPLASPAPSYHMFDAAYDPVRNVTVLTGGWEWGQSGVVPVRENWTYRYRPAPQREGKSPGAPRALALVLSDKGEVAALSWKPPASGAAAGYRVYRGEGEHPWTAKLACVTAAPVKETHYVETQPLAAGKHYYYQVRAVGADGKEGVPSTLTRTQPGVVREIFAARGADGRVELSWAESAGPGVAGYNVYRAKVEPVDLWQKGFDPAKIKGKLVRLNRTPLKDAAFTDDPGEAAGLCGESSGWAPLCAYVVRAMNARGEESGPSPVTLSIPAPPGPVLPVRLNDGRTLVISGRSPATPLAGHALYRLDSYKGDRTYRLRGAPQAGSVFVDGESWPSADRRAYYVIAVDGAGQLGVPSSPGWARDMP